MTDLILIAAIVLLLAVARGYVWACDRIAPAEKSHFGRDDAATALAPFPLLAAAGTADWVGLGLAVLLLAYLLVTLIVPERFR